ncbi:hypothetical protein BD414DRAFT_13845 [Trametes punicea]|nr:hypothetical protein BD414DRAFT_13845 [Trametes punicea]
MARALTAKTTTRSRKSCNRRTNTVPPAANALLTARLAYALHFTPAIPSEHNAAVPQPEDTPSEHASGAGQRDKKANSAYICELVNCKKVFSRSADLRRHQSSVHRLERPHKCDLCHKRYAQKTSLRVHLLKQTSRSGGLSVAGWLWRMAFCARSGSPTLPLVRAMRGSSTLVARSSARYLAA